MDFAQICDELFKYQAETPADDRNFQKFMMRIERCCVDRALELADGNKSAAARILGLQRTTLVEKLKMFKRVLDAPPAKQDQMADLIQFPTTNV